MKKVKNTAALIKAAPQMLNELMILKTCCEEALSGEWDRGDEGFAAMLDSIASTIAAATRQ